MAAARTRSAAVANRRVLHVDVAQRLEPGLAQRGAWAAAGGTARGLSEADRSVVVGTCRVSCRVQRRAGL